jgi:hypothetical protein
MTWFIFGLTLISVTISAVTQIVLKHGMPSQAIQAALSEGGMHSGLGVLAKLDVSQAYPFVGLGFLLTR